MGASPRARAITPSKRAGILEDDVILEEIRKSGRRPRSSVILQRVAELSALAQHLVYECGNPIELRRRCRVEVLRRVKQ